MTLNNDTVTAKEIVNTVNAFKNLTAEEKKCFEWAAFGILFGKELSNQHNAHDVDENEGM